MLIYTELFGLCEVTSLPTIVIKGTIIKSNPDLVWKVANSTFNTRNKPTKSHYVNHWNFIHKDDLPNKLKLSLLILDQHT